MGVHAVQLRDVHDQRAKGHDGCRDEFRDAPRIAGRLEEPLAQVQEVASDLGLARPPQIDVGHPEPGERVVAGDHHVSRQDLTELEREGVERASQLTRRKEQRHGQALLLPVGREGGETREVVVGQVFDDGERVHVVVLKDFGLARDRRTRPGVTEQAVRLVDEERPKTRVNDGADVDGQALSRLAPGSAKMP